MKYSFNLDKSKFVFASKANVNASYKKLGAVCDHIRYMPAGQALYELAAVADMMKPIRFRRHNAHMGARHELGGQKGRYPQKAAREVLKVVQNAIVNAGNKGLDGESMYIVHAMANKGQIMRRGPSRGSSGWGRGQYGRGSSVHSDLEFAKIEIGLAVGDEKELTHNMKYFIKKKTALLKAQEPKAKVNKSEKSDKGTEKKEKKVEKAKDAEPVKAKA